MFDSTQYQSECHCSVRQYSVSIRMSLFSNKLCYCRLPLDLDLYKEKLWWVKVTSRLSSDFTYCGYCTLILGEDLILAAFVRPKMWEQCRLWWSRLPRSLSSTSSGRCRALPRIPPNTISNKAIKSSSIVPDGEFVYSLITVYIADVGFMWLGITLKLVASTSLPSTDCRPPERLLLLLLLLYYYCANL